MLSYWTQVSVHWIPNWTFNPIFYRDQSETLLRCDFLVEEILGFLELSIRQRDITLHQAQLMKLHERSQSAKGIFWINFKCD